MIRIKKYYLCPILIGIVALFYCLILIGESKKIFFVCKRDKVVRKIRSLQLENRNNLKANDQAILLDWTFSLIEYKVLRIKGSCIIFSDFILHYLKRFGFSSVKLIGNLVLITGKIKLIHRKNKTNPHSSVWFCWKEVYELHDKVPAA